MPTKWKALYRAMSLLRYEPDYGSSRDPVSNTFYYYVNNENLRSQKSFNKIAFKGKYSIKSLSIQIPYKIRLFEFKHDETMRPQTHRIDIILDSPAKLKYFVSFATMVQMEEVMFNMLERTYRVSKTQATLIDQVTREYKPRFTFELIQKFGAESRAVDADAAPNPFDFTILPEHANDLIHFVNRYMSSPSRPKQEIPGETPHVVALGGNKLYVEREGTSTPDDFTDAFAFFLAARPGSPKISQYDAFKTNPTTPVANALIPQLEKDLAAIEAGQSLLSRFPAAKEPAQNAVPMAQPVNVPMAQPVNVSMAQPVPMADQSRAYSVPYQEGTVPGHNQSILYH